MSDIYIAILISLPLALLDFIAMFYDEIRLTLKKRNAIK